VSTNFTSNVGFVYQLMATLLYTQHYIRRWDIN